MDYVIGTQYTWFNYCFKVNYLVFQTILNEDRFMHTYFSVYK